VIAASRSASASVIENPRLIVQHLDVTSDSDVEQLRLHIIKSFGRLDILINNAGVYLDDPRLNYRGSVCDYEPRLLLATMDVNLVGSFRLIRAFLPLMKANNFGRIVNVSSGMGRRIEIQPSSLFYRTSKAALNFLTSVLAVEVEGYNIKINAVCPGWIQTDMGGARAIRTVQDGARGVIHAALVDRDGPNGVLLRDGQPLQG
jgi:NAD(P)-dependent dehydrogenase (short-subunit alcohol dehydrogenase family)